MKIGLRVRAGDLVIQPLFYNKMVQREKIRAYNFEKRVKVD